MTRHLNLIARSNGVGLDRDVDLIRESAHAAGYRVTFSHCRAISPLARFLPGTPRFDANLFLERIFPRWLSTAPINLLIPNQERFPERHLPRLRKIDHVFCKSHHALEIFQKHHPSCLFTGFTSKDLFDPDIPKKEKSFLHLAGRSTLKGTEAILALWKKHPEWPKLTLLQHPENAPADLPANVHLIRDYLSEQDLRKLINEHAIHLCPSLSEGWGHYIVEAMSCGAVVITTDGPPMHELVQPDRGLLVEVGHSGPRHLGVNYHVDANSLEATIARSLALPPEKIKQLGTSARDWFVQNHHDFQRRFLKALADTFS